MNCNVYLKLILIGIYFIIICVVKQSILGRLQTLMSCQLRPFSSHAYCLLLLPIKQYMQSRKIREIEQLKLPPTHRCARPFTDIFDIQNRELQTTVLFVCVASKLDNIMGGGNFEEWMISPTHCWNYIAVLRDQ